MNSEQINEIKKYCDVLTEEPMSLHTSFKIGGPAEVFASPSSADSIIHLIRYCAENHIPYYVIGNGSNLLVSDGGVRGVVIHIGKNYSNVEMYDKYVSYSYIDKNDIYIPSGKKMLVAESGALLSYISAFALKHGLSGFEFASGIPGTIGGAAVMNAGAYDGETADVMYGSLIYDIDNDEVKFIKGEYQEFSYRNSIYQQNGYVVLLSFLGLTPGNENEIRDKINDLSARRRSKQPIEYPSAGSTFKRPVGGFAASLIDECGLKGRTVGGAQVSEKHAGFIINTGNATCKDVLELIDIIKRTVKEEKGIELSPEVKYIGGH